MRLYGKLIKENITIRDAVVEMELEGASFRDVLEKCFVELCRELDIPVPLWLRNNTVQFAGYRKTFFTSDQFVENVEFDKLIIEAD